MKNKKIILVSILLIGIYILIFFSFYNKPIKEKKEYSKASCIKKGNKCSQEQIKEGIYLSFAVNDKKTYDFYMIDNDENYMTLLCSKNLGKSQWNTENINMKGPVTPIYELYELTKDWTNVLTIDGFTYDDYGYKSCLKNASKEEKNYCSEGGYHNIKLSKENSYVETNILNDDKYYIFDLDDEFKARLITVEELLNLDMQIWLKDNLQNGEGYWTMSSSTAANISFSSGAYALMYDGKKTSIESINVSLNLGLRPVIKIEKAS